MASHGWPPNNTLHMVKHNPRILQNLLQAACYQTCSTTNPMYQHFENENLIAKNLTWETTFLYVIITIS
jgi:hypothetical protein